MWGEGRAWGGLGRGGEVVPTLGQSRRGVGAVPCSEEGGGGTGEQVSN